MKGLGKQEVIKVLKNKILTLEGFKSNTIEAEQPDFGLGKMTSAFPGNIFPMGVVHEFISPTATCATATNGFVAGLLSTLMLNNVYCLWVSTRRSLFPLGLAYFGIEPHRIIFVDVKKSNDALWVMEQGLKCRALAAVVAEINEITFAQSQRLQLAVEESKVTGFLHRKKLRTENTLACVSRWKIRPVASHIEGDLPGVGIPMWEVQLEKIRNGKPGSWIFSWAAGKFMPMSCQSKTGIYVDKSERYA